MIAGISSDEDTSQSDTNGGNYLYSMINRIKVKHLNTLNENENLLKAKYNLKECHGTMIRREDYRELAIAFPRDTNRPRQ